MLYYRLSSDGTHLLTSIWKYEDISLLSASLHWLPIHARIHFKIILFVFKSLNGLAPAYLFELLQVYTPTRSLRSADLLLLSVPKTKLKLRGDRAFAVVASKLSISPCTLDRLLLCF